MPELTTAQRLAAYRDELLEAKFFPADVVHLVAAAAPSLVEDIQLAADIEDAPALTVRVRLESHVDPESLGRAVDQAKAMLQQSNIEEI
ncbi:hypothetical protein ACBI99_44715 [Nonomuraea sp. ATR24]|uniref:hypothetical protein n=1 Tax=Nonomuraea sp. ATR24 TaxID=1676744 RepID=UPI0035C2387C